LIYLVGLDTMKKLRKISGRIMGGQVEIRKDALRKGGRTYKILSRSIGR
jgi:hypothetical protein